MHLLLLLLLLLQLLQLLILITFSIITFVFPMNNGTSASFMSNVDYS